MKLSRFGFLFFLFFWLGKSRWIRFDMKGARTKTRTEFETHLQLDEERKNTIKKNKLYTYFNLGLVFVVLLVKEMSKMPVMKTRKIEKKKKKICVIQQRQMKHLIFFLASYFRVFEIDHRVICVTYGFSSQFTILYIVSKQCYVNSPTVYHYNLFRFVSLARSFFVSLLDSCERSQLLIDEFGTVHLGSENVSERADFAVIILLLHWFHEPIPESCWWLRACHSGLSLVVQLSMCEHVAPDFSLGSLDDRRNLLHTHFTSTWLFMATFARLVPRGDSRKIACETMDAIAWQFHCRMCYNYYVRVLMNVCLRVDY